MRKKILHDFPLDTLLLVDGVHVLIQTQQIDLNGGIGVTGHLDGRVGHGCELIIDAQVSSGFLVVHVSIEIQVDGNHEIVIAIVCRRDGDFRTVRFPEKVLQQVVATQVAGFVVVVVIRRPGLAGFSFAAFPPKFERVVEKRFVVDRDSQLRQVGVNHSQAIAGIRCIAAYSGFVTQTSGISFRAEQNH